MVILALMAAAAMSPGDGKTAALDDWHQLSIYGVGSDGPGPIYLQVHAGDLDGDGRADDSVIKLLCSDGKLTQAFVHDVKAPRDTASGQASGKRMHKPVTFVKEWGPASPQLMAVKPTYDVKNMKGNERTAADGWTMLTLAHADGLCPAAAAAIVKSKSNITNN